MKSPEDHALAAYLHLAAGQPDAALALLGDIRPRRGVLAESVLLCAQALMCEAKGDEGAKARFARVHDLGVPLPALLQACGRHFKRAADFDRAHHCYALLQNFVPGAIGEFMDQLPPTALPRYAPWVVRQMISAPRPDLYGLQRYKAALADLWGPDAAALAFAQMRGIQLAQVATLEITSLRDYARSRGLLYEDLYPGRTVSLPAPRQLGVSSPDSVTVRTRDFFFCVLEDVVVSSKSNFIFTAHHALLDFQFDELEMFPLNLDVDPAVIAPRDEQITALIEKGAVTHPPLDQALSLLGVHSYNFGHWLLEFLPRVWACLDRPGFQSVPILVDEQMHPQLRPALGFFVGPNHPIRIVKPGESLRVKKLWTGSMITYFPVGPKPSESETDDPIPIDSDAFANLVGKASAAFRKLDQTGGSKRIYLARQRDQHRKLVNHADVEKFFAAHDFEIYDPGTLPFVEQLRRVRNADLIVGPDGSSLWLAFLARPGTKVGYLNNPYLEEHWWIQANHESLGHHLHILTGEVVNQNPQYRKFSDYRIDPAVLPHFLEELLST